ncbi:3beta-hydroxysteroid-dehydrogenase/decarboxylase isoform 3 [Zostera marina]|uniref:Reticulon-like protein n=1 Tax=Zostera marina TaxID=29655 RepID=A0A0K9PKK9_ZOSMR|nr:3beta-hydroxysteroid-dehydrogenase/decarboxylase isoform 3 [Zostera marina]
MAVGERENETFPPSGDGNVCTVVGRRNDPLVNSLILMLLKTKEWDVRLADLTKKDGLGDLGENWSEVKIVGTDLMVRSQVFEAIRGSSAVFLMDLSEPLVYDSYDCYVSIVQGTKNVVNICKECKVKRLIYNSSADVVFDGLHEIHNGNESLPYPYKFEDTLIDFKAQSESIVLIANGSDGLLTCALRPSNTFGPKDMHFIKFLVNKAQTGAFKFIIGSGEPLADFTYVDNVSYAHILAEKALCSKESSVAGKPFFITNLEPMKIWEFIALTLHGLGYQRPYIHLPTKLALFFVMIMDWLCRELCWERNARSSFFTISMIHALSRTRTFDCSKAKNILGYLPIVSLKEGISLTIDSFSDLANKTLISKDRDISIPSKAEKFLGSREVAEILLWRDEKKTFSYIVGLFFLYYWFLLSGRTWITSVAKLLQLVMIILFIYGRLPSSVFNFHIGKLSPSYFYISETSVKNIIKPIANLWNQGVYILRSIAQGRDGRLFLKVCGSLYLLTLFLRFSLNTLTGLGLVTVFTIFIVYEQHETEVDRLVSISSVAGTKLWNKANGKLPEVLTKYIREF